MFSSVRAIARPYGSTCAAGYSRAEAEMHVVIVGPCVLAVGNHSHRTARAPKPRGSAGALSTSALVILGFVGGDVAVTRLPARKPKLSACRGR